ncbi:isocitrate/isopropylmalate dehydrogenase family protein [Bradyrhizobium sp. BR 10261]|uniref:isocitrate/isopropylmalate dehydrogenase family protein n=1 Tax=Bradyrhizobium sp. BR 10261 TaxID=2749992 RepID=UPI001C64CF3F|nr:isocitrate/isopropylmalate family dehydrogenase [Bradyrhizobium sp. BR 10261]MBW7967356.1 isocitrate/isopropylmalate dehydrogenase family protein [Bradyrhizobium sp. BR 10261]
MDILILEGDGIGPEIAASCASILTHLNAERNLGLTLERRSVGLATLPIEGTTLPSSVRRAAEQADGIVLAPLSTFSYPPAAEGGINASAEFRNGLNLFANFRPCRRRRANAGADIDLIMVRENTEGFYACRTMHAGSGEFMPDPETAFALRKITSGASRAIAREALLLASTRRNKLTVVHKANVLKLSDGLFLETVRSAATEFPSVEIEEQLVDATAALLVREPAKFDVVLTTNMFGDILSNEAAEIAGGLGMAPSLNAGADRAMAQAAHGSAPDIAGQNRANPAGLILSNAMLLNWLGQRARRSDLVEAANAIELAIDTALSDPARCTPDQGGSATTVQFTETIIRTL